jgi:hypothetical protein
MPIPIPAESYPLLMDLINQTYLDRVEQITAAQVDDSDDIIAVALDGRKKLACKVTDDDINIRLMGGEKVTNSLKFAAQQKKKNCTKGISCGMSCISATRTCKKPLSPNQKTQKKSIVDTAKTAKQTKKEPIAQPKTDSQPAPTGREPINSYEHFQNEVIKAIDKVSSGADIVEIWEVRKSLGERVSRPNFNKWLLEAQSREVLQLQGGSVRSGDRQQLLDSVKTELSGYRTSVSILSRPKKELGYDKTARVKQAEGKIEPIKTYEDFEKAAGKKIKQFIEDHSSSEGEVMEISKLRSALGDAVSKADFDKHLLQMFYNDKVTLGHNSLAEKDADGVTGEIGSKKHEILL